MTPLSLFTPLPVLLGGMLIGLALVLLLSLTGRFVGVGSMTAGLEANPPTDWNWRLMFLAGLVVGAGSYAIITGDIPQPRSGFSQWLLVGAGMLVGYGSSMGPCNTNVDAVCGRARHPAHSIIPAGVLLGFAVFTNFAMRHWPGLAR